jgi:hypothetical protein
VECWETLDLPRPKTVSKVSGSSTHVVELREMGREEAGWGAKVRMRTFGSKKTRRATRILRREDGMVYVGSQRVSREQTAQGGWGGS